MHQEVLEKARRAKEAAMEMAILDTEVKNKGLEAMAEALVESKEQIMAANQKDLEKAEKNGLARVLIERLALDEKKIFGMAQGLREVAALEDPIGKTITAWKRPNGLEIMKVRVPLGVIGMVYESRPNVTVDAAGLCLKSGNSIVLRGGSEAINSNITIWKIITQAAYGKGVPKGAIQLIETTDREAVGDLLTLNQYIDVIIPRGGHNLIQRVVREATVPVIQTGVGNCHTYVDADADMEMAAAIVVNAKTHRPGVCNAMETLLVNEKIASAFLPMVTPMLEDACVELRGCEKARKIIPNMKPASEEDWATEYLDLVLAIRVVKDLDEAIAHIHRYGTKHSEAIVTNNYRRGREFVRRVDAAAVYINASTRFTDGGQFGMGAEIGISTQNLHVRGPMGLEELTTNKYIIYGDGQIRS